MWGTQETHTNILNAIVHNQKDIPELDRLKSEILECYDSLQSSSAWRLILTTVLLYILYVNLRNFTTFVVGYGIIGSTKIIYRRILKWLFSIILSLPPIKKKVDKELKKTVLSMEESLIKNDPDLLQLDRIPEKGLSQQLLIRELEKLQMLKHSDWKNGRVSGAVYHGGEEMLDIQAEAYRMYSIANQLHPDVFPGVRKMEAEIVAMVLRLFNAPPEGCGSTTSGGTESLLLAGLAAREFGRKYRGIRNPEVVAPVTVHAGIEKACFYFGLKLHKVDLDPNTYQVDLAKVRALINRNTVLLVGSSPNYPHGIIDDIEGLSQLALKYNLLLHVDACLGSFVVPFLEKSRIHGDKTIPKFDFRVPGVTSISCDTHKYGFAPKGSSVIMYRDPKIRECQYYVSADWSGGMYGSPTLAGSRPGALMVGCWATLVYIGQEGYLQSCKEIVGASMKFKTEIQKNKILSDHLEIIGDPLSSVVAFRKRNDNKSLLNIYQLGDLLNKKGWHFASLQNPAALHFAFTRLTVPVVDELIQDLADSVLLCTSDSLLPESEMAVLYGVAGSVKTTGVADKLIIAFLDTLYKT